MPKSPNDTAAPPRAWPLRRPRWVLRCLTFLGINMSVRLLAEVRGLVMLATLALHLLVASQAALELVGFGRGARQQVGHRCLFGLGVSVGVGLGLGVGHGHLSHHLGRLHAVEQ